MLGQKLQQKEKALKRPRKSNRVSKMTGSSSTALEEATYRPRRVMTPRRRGQIITFLQARENPNIINLNSLTDYLRKKGNRNLKVEDVALWWAKNRTSLEKEALENLPDPLALDCQIELVPTNNVQVARVHETSPFFINTIESCLSNERVTGLTVDFAKNQIAVTLLGTLMDHNVVARIKPEPMHLDEREEEDGEVEMNDIICLSP